MHLDSQKVRFIASLEEILLHSLFDLYPLERYVTSSPGMS